MWLKIALNTYQRTNEENYKETSEETRLIIMMIQLKLNSFKFQLPINVDVISMYGLQKNYCKTNFVKFYVQKNIS